MRHFKTSLFSTDISVLAIVIGALAFGAVPASAVPVNWDAGTGTWTTSTNWDPTQVPLAGDDASINNGGVANQTGLPITVRNLNIGHRTSGVILPGNLGAGTVNLTNGNATISRDLRVGVTAAILGSLGSSNGTFITSGGVVTPGNVEVDGSAIIGSFQSGPTGTATGTVDIRTGGLSDISSGTTTLRVGASTGLGTGNGTLSVAEDIRQFSTIRIGENGSAFVNSQAIGDLTVGGQISNSFNSIQLRVGHATRGGDAEGDAEIGTGVDDVFSVDVGTSGSASTATASALGDLRVLSGGLAGDGIGELNVGKTTGSGMADGTLSVSGGISGFDDIEIGTVGTAARGNADGNVNILSGGLTGSAPAHLRVGKSEGSGDADGTLTVMGGIIDLDSVEVGRASDTGNGTGNINIQTGDLTGFGVGNLSVGWKTGAGFGTADGTLNVMGDVNGFSEVRIGLVENQGDAIGSLTLIDGDLTAEAVSVGVSTGTGAATGTLNLNDNLAIINDTLYLGGGATLQLGIGGTSRGLDFGAIDANMAFLGGALDLFFTFDPLPGVFDLIISEAFDGIMGDFDTVNFFGLASGTLASFGVVVDSVNGMDVEIYRMEIGTGNPIPDPPTQAVPEPSTLVMLVSGLIGLGLARRRRKTNAN